MKKIRLRVEGDIMELYADKELVGGYDTGFLFLEAVDILSSLVEAIDRKAEAEYE